MIVFYVDGIYIQPMKKSIFHNTVVALSMASLSHSAMSAWIPYTVKKGDQLGSLILSKKLDMPLWTKEGSVVKVAKYNSGIIKNADTLDIGQSIFLPESTVDFQATLAEAESQEVKLTQAATEKEVKAAPKQETNKTQEVYTPAHLRVGALLSFINYDLDRPSLSSSLKSDLIYGVMAQGEFPLEENLFLDLGFSYRKIKFKAPTASTLDSDDDSFFNFSLGMVKYWNGLSLGAGFQYGQELATIQFDNTSVVMKSFQVFSPYLKTRYNFFNRQRTSLSFELMGLYNLPSSVDRFDLDKGYNAVLSLDVERKLSEKSSLSFVPFVSYGKKELGTIEQKGTDSGLKVIYNLMD